MAETLPNGVVIPQGADLINSNGVQAMRHLGSSVDSQLANRALVGHAHSWGQVTGKPATFPPSAHTHPVSQVDGLQALLDGKASSTHAHSLAQVTGLVAALGAKADAEAVELGAGADANTLTTPGRYVETNAGDAATNTNFPEQRAGVLDVAANSDRLHVWQLWRPYAGNRLYMRSRTSGAWTSWEQLVTSTDSRLSDAR